MNRENELMSGIVKGKEAHTTKRKPIIVRLCTKLEKKHCAMRISKRIPNVGLEENKKFTSIHKLLIRKMGFKHYKKIRLLGWYRSKEVIERDRVREEI